VGLTMNRTHQLLAYADDVNLSGYNIDTINKNRQTLIEINVEKTTYMLLSRQQNADQNWDIKTANRLFESVSQFRYLGTRIINQNLIQEEIKNGNVCYHYLQKLLSSRLLSRKVKIVVCKIIILPVVVYGFETWSLTLR
jgi:hypothetical protein